MAMYNRPRKHGTRMRRFPWIAGAMVGLSWRIQIGKVKLKRAEIMSIRRSIFLFLAAGFIGLSGAQLSYAASSDGYRINPEDVLEISVWKEEDLQKTVTVRPDGGITLPLIGNQQASGKTTTELQSDLSEAMDAFIPDPVVTVSVVEIRGYKVYITGEVTEPGEYLMGSYIDVLQALTMAGGVTAFADLNDIRIIRRQGDRSEVLKFNYAQVQKGRKLEQNIVLKAGDTIVVP